MNIAIFHSNFIQIFFFSNSTCTSLTSDSWPSLEKVVKFLNKFFQEYNFYIHLQLFIIQHFLNYCMNCPWKVHPKR